MDITHFPLRILPLRITDSPSQDPPKVARVAHKIDLLFRPNSNQNIQVSRKMSWRVNEIEAAVRHLAKTQTCCRHLLLGPCSSHPLHRHGRIKRRSGRHFHHTIFGQQIRLEMLMSTSRLLTDTVLQQPHTLSPNQKLTSSKERRRSDVIPMDMAQDDPIHITWP